MSMRVARFSGTAVLEGANVLFRHFPALQKDPVKAMQIAEAIAGAMILEDAGRKIIQIVSDDEEESV
jgi:hypothetical protein